MTLTRPRHRLTPGEPARSGSRAALFVCVFGRGQVACPKRLPEFTSFRFAAGWRMSASNAADSNHSYETQRLVRASACHGTGGDPGVGDIGLHDPVATEQLSSGDGAFPGVEEGDFSRGAAGGGGEGFAGEVADR